MVELLEQARQSFSAWQWADAYRCLQAAAASGAPLAAEDLDLLARAAYLTGRDEEFEDAWARAHRTFLDADEVEAAVRCGFWLGLVLLIGGEEARGGGWIGRAGRLVAGLGRECAEQGYLLIPAGLSRMGAGDPAAALELFGQALEIAGRFDEADLRALALLGSGQALIGMGDLERGVRTLDEAMVAVQTGELSMVVAGIVYCAVILACQELLDVGRAQQWTVALRAWCDAQPDLVPYRGQCLVHRSQLAQLRGDWSAATVLAERACERLSDPAGQPAVGLAYYQRAELHRLRGEFTDAERTYALANQWGHSPHPGLALLRLAQGRGHDAAAAIHRVIDEAQRPGHRAQLLAAGVEIMLAVGDVAVARNLADELAQLSDDLDAALLRAMSSQATGAVSLAEGRARDAVAALHRARSGWDELAAPYEVARVQVLMAAACRDLGDVDTARMEEAAARKVFAEAGARPDLTSLDERAGRRQPTASAGLTAREVEVVRLVAAGLTNREIAAELVISEKTVARHLNNVFTRLGLANRAAATAYAFEHELM